MTMLRFLSAAVAMLLAWTPIAPAAASQGASRVQAWLAEIAEAEGYRLSWGSISSSVMRGDVKLRNIKGVDAAGRERLRIGGLTVQGARSTSSGTLTADTLVLESVELNGSTRSSIGRIALTRPDLIAVADLLSSSAARRTGVDAQSWWRRLAADRVEIRELQADAPGVPGRMEPMQVRLERVLAVNAEPGRIQRLEMDGLLQTSGNDGDRTTLSIAEIRADQVELGPAAYALVADLQGARLLSGIADLNVGLLEARGLRAQSDETGTVEIERQWFRTRPHVSGRSGIISFGNEGMHTRSAPKPSLFAPLLGSLFPPDGEVPMQWIGEIVYDLPDASVDYRQTMTVDRFGSFDLRADLSGVPDLSLREWRDVKSQDRRLSAMHVDDLSIALTDTGGLDRTVLALSEDRKQPTPQLRAAVAEQLGILVPALSPKGDARLVRWVGAVQEFVRVGGTLSIAATQPIPVAAIDSQRLNVGTIPSLADRYGLTVVRR